MTEARASPKPFRLRSHMRFDTWDVTTFHRIRHNLDVVFCWFKCKVQCKVTTGQLGKLFNHTPLNKGSGLIFNYFCAPSSCLRSIPSCCDVQSGTEGMCSDRMESPSVCRSWELNYSLEQSRRANRGALGWDARTVERVISADRACNSTCISNSLKDNQR